MVSLTLTDLPGNNMSLVKTSGMQHYFLGLTQRVCGRSGARRKERQNQGHNDEEGIKREIKEHGEVRTGMP